MKKLFLGILGSILLGQIHAQTVLKRIPIQHNHPYTIYVWDFYPGKEARWMSHQELAESGQYLPISWWYHDEIDVRIEPLETLEILLISSAGNCADSTHIVIRGSREMEKIKTGEIILGSGPYYFGELPSNSNLLTSEQ